MPVVTAGFIDARIEDIWAIVSDFGGLMRWHPQLVRVDCTGSTIGAIRTAHFADRWVSERLERLDHQNHVLAYVVTGSSSGNFAGAKGEITLTKISDRQTKIEWISSAAAGAEEDKSGMNAMRLSRIRHLETALGLPSN
jgi:hypothetical protein